MNLLFFDVSLFLLFLSIRDYIVLLVMYAFTVSEFHDLFPYLCSGSLKLKFGSETLMRSSTRITEFLSL